ncbi:MAG TPA: SLC13 family permease [Anaerolineae bacterium]|nr:SLC13 family permease [Anaerolineae bacterium]
MSPSAAFVLLVLAIAAALFITEKIRADLVALLVLVALAVSRILTPLEALSGFSSSAVITILGVFILTDALERTGVTQTLGLALVRLGGRSEGRMMLALMLGGAFLSLFMNNIAAGAVLMPAAVGLARERKISPSRLMMPLAFGTLLGGMATLLTTTNILASATLRDHNLPQFNLLTFAPMGIPAVVVGTLYMFFIGRRLLPHRAPADWERMMQAGRGRLADIYSLRERWFQARVQRDSPLAGMTLAEAGLGAGLGVNVIAILYDGKSRLAPPPPTRLNAGDTLYLEARQEQLESLRARGLEVLNPNAADGDGSTELGTRIEDEDIGLFEVILSPRSNAVGKTLREIHFREKYGLNVIAIWRAGRPRRVGVGDMALQSGDALLVLGPRRRAQLLQSEPDFIVLTTIGEENVRRSKAKWVVAIMAIVLGLSAIGVLPVAEAMLAGGLAAVLVGALTMDEAYQAIEWRVIFLIAGMLPAGVAMTKTGAALWIADGIVNLIGSMGPLVVLLALMLITMLLTQVMTGQATITILAPIALTTAQVIGGNAFTFVLGTALASSMAFLTPLGHPVNVFVMGPGGYKFNDFARVGLLLVILLLILFGILLPLIYGV